MQGGDYDQGFHEIRQISHEIRRISREIRMKSARFHEIRRISCGFHEIWRISWNPADFMWNRKTSCKEL